MIDSHCHIIYGVDDGSKDEEMSRAMLSKAKANGTKKIFATPHVIDVQSKPSWPTIVKRAHEINELSEGKIKIYPAAEVYMNWDLLAELGENGAYCINGGERDSESTASKRVSSRYMLVELPMHEIPVYADEFWYELQLKGVTPILAHPERYGALMDKLDHLLKWRQQGILLQINSGSLTGLFGKHAMASAKMLLQNDIVDLMGSDGHRAQGRDTNMSGAAEVIRAEFGEERLLRITERNPQRVLNGEPVQINVPKEIVRKKAKKSFWRRLFK